MKKIVCHKYSIECSRKEKTPCSVVALNNGSRAFDDFCIQYYQFKEGQRKHIVHCYAKGCEVTWELNDFELLIREVIKKNG